jgi:hypothetical protein
MDNSRHPETGAVPPAKLFTAGPAEHFLPAQPAIG